jgi:hypothetical protein
MDGRFPGYNAFGSLGTLHTCDYQSYQDKKGKPQGGETGLKGVILA